MVPLKCIQLNAFNSVLKCSYIFVMEFSKNDLAVVALILDEEEEKQQKKKRKWVHEAWKKREEGEFITLFKELIDDETKLFQKDRKLFKHTVQ